VLALRDNYRKDLKEVHDQVGARYVRFHAIFHDEVGVYDEDEKGTPVFNFSYVDQIYDGLLAQGVRPFVEISFMPRKLAAREAIGRGLARDRRRREDPNRPARSAHDCSPP